MTACITQRLCILCRQSLPPNSLLQLPSRQPGLRLSLPSPAVARLLSGDSKSLQPTPGTPGRTGKGLTEPLDRSSSASGDSILDDSNYRRSADPNNELREYIEYSKINSWHAAVGRRTPGKQRWRYERLVVGVCAVITLAYIYVRPENSVDEHFGMDEFGKGLFRPNPAMEHHIAATIQTVESRGGDATLYRNQLKILLKEKELELERERRAAKNDVKYDPKLHDVKY